MSAQDRIEALKREIHLLERQIESCRHDWGEAVYDPEKFREGYGSRLVTQGSDHWIEYEGFRDAIRPRWSRTCKLCGKKEYTYTQETVQIVQKPKFHDH